MSENKGMRELSLDEMNQVSGGQDFPYKVYMGSYYIHDEQSLAGFIAFIREIEAGLGRDAVASLLLNWMPNNTLKDEYMAAGLAGLDNALYHLCNSSGCKKQK